MKKILLMILIICCGVLLFSCGVETDDVAVETPGDVYVEYQEESEPQEEKQKETFENLPEPTMINANFEVTTNPDGTFVIETNLPDETELSLTLKGRGYLAQGGAVVDGGKAISERFTNQGDQLVGNYVLEVLMPIPSVQSDYVKHFIGKNGEYLDGPYLKGALGSVVVSKEFNVSFSTEKNTQSSDQTVSSPAVEKNSEPTGSYYRTPTGKKYHLDPDCGGKNSYRTDNISGLSACAKCAK